MAVAIQFGGALLAAVSTMTTPHFRQWWCKLQAAYLCPLVVAVASARAPFLGVFWGFVPALLSLILVLWPFGSCYELPQILAMDSFNAEISMNQYTFRQRILIDLEIILKARKTTKTSRAPCSIQKLPNEEPRTS